MTNPNRTVLDDFHFELMVREKHVKFLEEALEEILNANNIGDCFEIARKALHSKRFEELK